MKKTNKILSFLLALLMVFSIIPATSITSSATDGYYELSYDGYYMDIYNSTDDIKVPFSVEEYMGVWRQMERLVELGLVKSIGMSNMTITKLEQVLPLCKIKPTVLEVEINPTFQQPKLFDYCMKHEILPIAFSPMGSPCRPERDTEEGDVVILSPASTSFDRFANFMERGWVFKSIVQALEE